MYAINQPAGDPSPKGHGSLAFSKATMRRPIHFAPDPYWPGTEKFFSDYNTPEKYGIEIRLLTPRINKTNYGFQVRCKGKSFAGHISTQGDFIVKVKTLPSGKAISTPTLGAYSNLAGEAQ
jgi:hypothetical protein